MKYNQPGEAQTGNNNNDPGRAAVQQHRPERNLQEIERYEWICGTAAQIKLGGQRRDVEQQKQEQFAVTRVGLLAQPLLADDVQEY